ncbi:1-phosphofructokinase family hexose kinase [Nocardioides donggukensis]|uniref:1-phosphofructokinase family hexose kinase n=1 Tax=Nocardioides donggukensis TaxID=2774019 RepID=A0A927K3G7_9ACTN|nr:1-phosphofructokinase family hexose kinase [Nocardioides donggukensis]MBD8869091.1 1-phosphofructokinase family hexose kinase [Nocardioides donggukensis]
MIVTLTPNPSIDTTVALDGPLDRGAVQRTRELSSQAGGKGVNISRAAQSAGLPTTAVFPADPDDPFVHDLHAAGLPCRPEPVHGHVRVNLTITEPDGTTTKLNSPGNVADADLLARLESALLHEAGTGDWVVLAGSLPPGAPDDWYARLVSALRGTTARVAVDTSEEPLKALAAALPGIAPDLLKPNAEELASLTGHLADELEADPAATARAATQLVGRGVGAVLATLGSEGAVLATAEGAWHAVPPPTTVLSTVGAGDSSLFGYLWGESQGLPPAGRLRYAVAYGSAAAALPGTTIPEPGHLRPDLVTVHQLSTGAST